MKDGAAAVMKVGIPSTSSGQALRLRKRTRFASPLAPLRMTELVRMAGLGGILLLMFCANALGTTYYVSSSVGSDSNGGTSSSAPWQTIAHVNGQSFNPGDSILFRRGDVWNESLAPASSGSSGNPIAFDAYGTGAAPNLTGYYAVPATAWVLVTGNAWKAPVPATYTAINFCLFGSVWGQKVAAVSSNLTAPGDFYLANGYVYVYSVGSPATYYNEAIVPMALSNVPVININGQTWLTFQHFLVNWFDQYGVYVQGTSDHLVFANMEADSMIPQGTQPLGFYVDESAPGPGDIKIYNAEAHLNYDGFRFDGAATAITMVNDKAYANRDGALVDNTGAVSYSYCHFYASSLAVAGSTDVEYTNGSGPTAGAGNIAADTAPAVQVWQRYPAEVTLTVDDEGMTPGADTYYAGTVLPIADAAGVPVGAAITVGYPLAQTLVSEFQGWVNAGRDVTSHSISHTYYTNTDALDVQYTGGGTAASLSISGKTLTITVTGASDSVSYNLAQGQAEGTISGLQQALAATGKFTTSYLTPCQGPYGTGCSAYTAQALLAQDLADVSGQDVKSAVYHMQLNVTRLTTDEITLSRQWMTTNLTGLPATPVYVYPGGYETTTMQGITEGVPYVGARGALKEDLGVKDTYADGFNAQNITSFGVNPSWMGSSGVTPAILNQKIQALVWKEAVWGVPWGIFWHLNELTNSDPVGGTEITNLIQDFKASGATIRTNTSLVNWLLSGTQETGTDGNDYYTFPATSMTLDFRPTKNSPVVDAGQNLGAAYALDINGVNQNSYGSGWEIGAHVYEGYAAYGTGLGGGRANVYVFQPPAGGSSSLATIYANASGASIHIPWSPDNTAAALGGWETSSGSGTGGYNFTNFDEVINTQLGYGAKSVVIILQAVTDGSANTYSPNYVFTTGWAASIGSSTGQLYVCAGGDYPGSGSIPINTCAQGVDNTAFPATFQAPFAVAWKAAVAAAINHVKSASYASKIAYIRVGGGSGGEWVPQAPTALETQVSPSTLAGLQTVWAGYVASVESTIRAQSSGLLFDQAMNSAGVSYSFADADAAIGTSNGFGIGNQGLQNNDIGTFATYGTASGGSNLTGYPSNDFIYNFALGGAPFYECQTFAKSDPTYVGIPPWGTMGSLVALLPFAIQRGTTDLELYYEDWQVAYDPTSPNYATYNAAYQAAIQQARAGTSTIIGSD
jgi:hypothetical protein